MARAVRAVAISLGMISGMLLVLPNWQRCLAQEPGIGAQEEKEPSRIVRIPTTGYKPQPQSADSEQGRKLFQNLNCTACHSIHNVGGDLGPMLDGIGGRRSHQFLIAHLSASPEAEQAYEQISGMELAGILPHSRFSPQTAELLSDYLNTLPEPEGGFIVLPHTTRIPAQEPAVIKKDFRPAVKTAQSQEGEKLYNKFGCVACHAIGETGGWVGPRLDGVGARHDRAYIVAHITDAQAQAKELSTPGWDVKSEMPRFTLSKEAAQEITDYLLTLPGL